MATLHKRGRARGPTYPSTGFGSARRPPPATLDRPRVPPVASPPSAEARELERADELARRIPAGATTRRQRVRCQRPGCGSTHELHGPYWYAFWREAGRMCSAYIGSEAAYARFVLARERVGEGIPGARTEVAQAFARMAKAAVTPRRRTPAPVVRSRPPERKPRHDRSPNPARRKGR